MASTSRPEAPPALDPSAVEERPDRTDLDLEHLLAAEPRSPLSPAARATGFTLGPVLVLVACGLAAALAAAAARHSSLSKDLKTVGKQLMVEPEPHDVVHYPALDPSCAAAQCLEDGKPDADCCSMSGLGSCGGGYLFVQGPQCFANGAVRTCCTKAPREAPRGSCSFPEEKKCTEGGKLDPDCCAQPGSGGCVAGYRFTKGEECFQNTGAVFSCCISEDEFQDEPDEHDSGDKKPDEHDSGDKSDDAVKKDDVRTKDTDDKSDDAVEKDDVRTKDTQKRHHTKEDDQKAQEDTKKESHECAKSGENCADAQCCTELGAQCYGQTNASAFCQATCFDDKWNCKELGPRTPDDSTSMGSWPGSNCAWTKRCNLPELTCFKKNNYYASCQKTCERGNPNATDDSYWFCEKLGGFEATSALPAAGDNEATMGTSLFCMTVASAANTVSTSPEGTMLSNMKEKGASIYSCDGHAVYWAPKAQRGEWKSVSNVGIFTNIWSQVQKAGEYKNFDWTAKVDPDTVFFPDRLKRHLDGLRAPAGAALFLENCDFKFHFQGSFEVMSKLAVDKYLEGQSKCVKHIGLSGGEDEYIRLCMDALGIRFMKDTSLLNDKYTWTTEYDMLDTSFCKDAWKVAFHPLKSVGLWNSCHDAAQEAKPGRRLSR